MRPPLITCVTHSPVLTVSGLNSSVIDMAGPSTKCRYLLAAGVWGVNIRRMVGEHIERMCGATNQRIKSADFNSQLAAVIGGPNVGALVYQLVFVRIADGQALRVVCKSPRYCILAPL